MKTYRFLWLPVLASGLIAGSPLKAENPWKAYYVTFRPEQKTANPLEKVKHLEDRIPTEALPFSRKSLVPEAVCPWAAPLALRSSDVFDHTYIVYVDTRLGGEEVAEAFFADPMVVSVEEAPEYRLASVSGTGLEGEDAGNPVFPGKWGKELPNDPYAGVVDGLDLGWHMEVIKGWEALELQAPSSKVTVAVVDNAIWGEHPDLQIPEENQYNVGNGMASSSAFLEEAGVDQDMQCDEYAMNTVSCVSYSLSHGTHVAGLLAAKTGNGEGVSSLAGGVNLLAVAVPSLGGDFPGNPFEGIRWAVNHGADIVNCSWVGSSYTSTEKAFIEEILADGVIVVAGAGNGGTYDDLAYPAAFPGVISVGACNYDGSRYSYSNYGGWVDIVAPGGLGAEEGQEMMSTTWCVSQKLPLRGYEDFTGLHYDFMQGTSMATPLVSGACALMLSMDSTLDAAGIQEILVSTARKSESLGMPHSGILDVEAALKAVSDRVKREKPDYITSFTGICESGMPKVFWMVDEEAATAPDFLRLYEDGVLVCDSLPFEDGEFQNPEAAMQANHRYEICGLKDGVESFRKETCVSLGLYYLVNAEAVPAEGGMVTGTGRYEHRAYAMLRATPSPGWRFVRWDYYDTWTGEEYENPVLQFYVEQEYLGIKALFEPENAANESMSQGEPALKVWPNPVSSVLKWEAEKPFSSLEILDLSGRVLMVLDPAQTEFDLSRLQAGCYLLRAFDGKATEMVKIIKR